MTTNHKTGSLNCPLGCTVDTSKSHMETTASQQHQQLATFPQGQSSQCQLSHEHPMAFAPQRNHPTQDPQMRPNGQTAVNQASEGLEMNLIDFEVRQPKVQQMIHTMNVVVATQANQYVVSTNIPQHQNVNLQFQSSGSNFVHNQHGSHGQATPVYTNQQQLPPVHQRAQPAPTMSTSATARDHSRMQVTKATGIKQQMTGIQETQVEPEITTTTRASNILEKQNIKVYQETTQQVDALQKENMALKEEVQKLKSEADGLRSERSDLTDRLSKEMNDKMSRDETSVENISLKNRPMKIAEGYQLFASAEWLAAKGCLDEYYKGKKYVDETLIDFLLKIIMSSAEQSLKVQTLVEQRIYDVIRDPLGKECKGASAGDKSTGRREKPGVVNISVSLQNAVSDHLRSLTSDSIVSRIKEATIKELTNKDSNAVKVLQQVPIVQFMDKIAEISWKMVNQRPKLEFHCPGVRESYKELIQEPYWGSDDPSHPQSRVQQYVLPVMYHGSAVMAKGKVIIKVADTLKKTFPATVGF